MQRFGADSMINAHMKNEEFIVTFYWDMLLNSKERFGVNFVIEKHTTNEEFIVRFYSNILLNSK
jgi:hypothetical protein